MKNIGKIILLVLGVALIALGVKGLLDIPGQKALLENAVYLDEPTVLPENEGKLVIIHGKPEMTAPVYDEELRLTLNTIKAYRYREVYKKTGFNTDEQKWEWVTNEQKSLTGEAKIGDFELDSAILIAFPTESHYTDFDAGETAGYSLFHANSGSSDLYVLPEGGYYADEMTLDGTDNGWLTTMGFQTAADREGTTAYRYRFYDPEKNDEHTIAGIQKGNLLAKDENLGPVVKDGVLSKEQILSANQGGIMGGSIVFMLIGAVLAVLGLRKPKVKTHTYYDKEQANQ